MERINQNWFKRFCFVDKSCPCYVVLCSSKNIFLQIGVNTESKEVKLSNGNSLKYDHLVLATGAKPRTLQIPGSEASNIFILRTPNDANQIAALSEGKNLVIVGTSFIGMEVAAALVGELLIMDGTLSPQLKPVYKKDFFGCI